MFPFLHYVSLLLFVLLLLHLLVQIAMFHESQTFPKRLSLPSHQATFCLLLLFPLVFFPYKYKPFLKNDHHTFHCHQHHRVCRLKNMLPHRCSVDNSVRAVYVYCSDKYWTSFQFQKMLVILRNRELKNKCFLLWTRVLNLLLHSIQWKLNQTNNKETQYHCVCVLPVPTLYYDWGSVVGLLLSLEKAHYLQLFDPIKNESVTMH